MRLYELSQLNYDHFKYEVDWDNLYEKKINTRQKNLRTIDL